MDAGVPIHVVVQELVPDGEGRHGYPLVNGLMPVADVSVGHEFCHR